MTISVHDRKRLWGLSASRCAFPDCRQELVEQSSDGRGAVLVGQEAHIVARSQDGPRGISDLSESERDTYDNLILVCARHHIVIDNDVAAYPVGKLLDFKADHELWVRANLSVLLAHQAELERYGEIIDEWSERALLDKWRSWTYGLTNALSPRLHTETMEQITELGGWLLSIIWPGTFPDLERAFQNFHAVLRDFITVFNQEADWVDREGEVVAALTNRSSDVLLPESQRRHELEHADLVVDLALELTRAANYLCEQARKAVDARFRLAEGALLMIFSGGGEDLMRPEYSQEETGDLYPGLEEFATLRFSRDLHCRAR
jgi:hypothetical protein